MCVQKILIKMVRSLKGKTECLRSVGLLSLEKRRLRGNWQQGTPPSLGAEKGRCGEGSCTGEVQILHEEEVLY